MMGFYRQLRETLEKGEGDVYTETILRGQHAGEKRILSGNDPETGPSTAKENGKDVFRERIGRPAKLIICGAGHVSIPIIKMGKMLGFTVTVLEDRPKFADNARAAGADQVICEPFEDALEKMPGDWDYWFVIVTRGERYERTCLE